MQLPLQYVDVIIFVELVLNTTLQAARGMIAHGSGKQSVDEKIAMGYLHVNTGTNEFVSTISHLLSVYILSPYTV